MALIREIQIGDLYQYTGDKKIYGRNIVKGDMVFVVDKARGKCTLYNPRTNNYIMLLIFPNGTHTLGEDFLYLEEL